MKRLDLILFAMGAFSAMFFFFIIPIDFNIVNQKYPWISFLIFVPVFLISFFYGSKITEQVFMNSFKYSIKQKLTKLFFVIFLISAFFSVVNLALNSDFHIPNELDSERDFGAYIQNFLTVNGGITFLTVYIISILAVLSKQMIKMDGVINKIFTVVGTFLLFSISILTITDISPTEYQIYLYTFYQAGIIFGAFFTMLSYTSNLKDTDSFEW